MSADDRSRDVPPGARPLHEHLRLLVDQMPAVLWAVDRNLVFTTSTGAGLASLGLRPGEVVGRSLWEFFSTDDPDYEPIAAHRRALAGTPVSYRLRWNDLTFLSHVEPLRDATGEIVGVVGLAQDVTELQQAHAALAASREWLLAVFHAIGDGVIATDGAGRIELMNAVAERLTGWAAADARGRPLAEVYQLLSERDGTLQPAVVDRSVDPAAPATAERHGLVRARDGREYWVSDVAAPIPGRSGRTAGIVLVVRDRTEEWAKQRAAEQVERARSLELLAGGIAHDFNNLLAQISVNAGVARRAAGADALARQLADIEDACARAMSLTKQLLRFARSDAVQRDVVDLGPLIRDHCEFAARGSSAAVAVDVAPDLWRARVDPGQMGQVLTNLVLNAIEVSPPDARVTVTARNVVVDRARGSLPPGRYVEVTVTDRGPGMPPDLAARAFEPYVSTKADGRGLGLAITRAIVVQHGGDIAVKSSPGAGSSFVVTLPAIAGADERVEESPPLKARVLMLEDEPALARAVAEFLRTEGYSVVHVADGAAAIREFDAAAARGEPFDVALLDLTVPGGMGGAAALAELRRRAPDLRAIAMTGYAADDVADHGFTMALAKPFRVDELLDAIDHTLRAVPAPASGR
ncbi:MAG: PAS domain S-box protein [Deltaproteobacteria bacterium]|nr:MAG: PAS domain S-box protein [Deltaproteobacteria bacterium]